MSRLSSVIELKYDNNVNADWYSADIIVDFLLFLLGSKKEKKKVETNARLYVHVKIKLNWNKRQTGLLNYSTFARTFKLRSNFRT